MENLLSHDQALTYQDFVEFENIFSKKEIDELDKVAIHKVRLRCEYSLALKY